MNTKHIIASIFTAIVLSACGGSSDTQTSSGAATNYGIIASQVTV